MSMSELQADKRMPRHLGVLAIAIAIAQAHQGSIQVQSITGKGSIFTIRLPITFTKPSTQIDTSCLELQPSP